MTINWIAITALIVVLSVGMSVVVSHDVVNASHALESMLSHFGSQTMDFHAKFIKP